MSYTFSKSIDDSSGQGLTSWLAPGGFSSLQDPNNRGLERSLSQFDATHVTERQLCVGHPDWPRPARRTQLEPAD